MKHVAYALALLFALLSGGETDAASASEGQAARPKCQKNSTKKECKKQKKASPPKASALPAGAPVSLTPLLSRKQEEMRDAFVECIGRSKPANPITHVVDFVFSEQETREGGGIRAYWLAFRGSTAHHGHEVCLTRAFGLKGFRTQTDITNEAGNLLVEITSPDVEVVEREIPPDRRLTRPWVRDYVSELARDLRARTPERGAEHTPLLRVTSMIRSFEDQAKEVKRGLSPADCRHEFLCSAHTSGSAIDIGLKDVGRSERAWLLARLMADQKARKIFFIVENSHYHVFVLPPDYMGEE